MSKINGHRVFRTVMLSIGVLSHPEGVYLVIYFIQNDDFLFFFFSFAVKCYDLY